MKEVWKAIVSRYEGDATLVAATLDGPILGRVPELLAYPYCRMMQMGEAFREHTMSSTKLDRIEVRFSIFGNTDTSIIDLQTALHARFDKADFTITNKELVSCKLVSHQFMQEPFPDANGEAIFHAHSTFEIVVQTN